MAPHDDHTALPPSRIGLLGKTGCVIVAGGNQAPLDDWIASAMLFFPSGVLSSKGPSDPPFGLWPCLRIGVLPVVLILLFQSLKLSFELLEKLLG